MYRESIKLRCTTTGCGHEICLPNGKTIIIDPYYPDTVSGCTKEDVEGGDYVIVTHTHYDHDFHLGWITEKFNSKVILPAMDALQELKYQKLPFNNVYPVYPRDVMTFPDFKLEVFLTKHNSLGKLTYDPDNDMTFKKMGVPGDLDADALGGLFSYNYLITTNNGFKILIASGQNLWVETLSEFQAIRPNMLIRQVSVRPFESDLSSNNQVSAKELAKLFVSYNAQLLIPFHMDGLKARWGEEKLNQYLQEAAEEVERLDSGALFIIPEAWKWYSVGIGMNLI